MPRYDYRCRTCDTGFEVSRPLSEPATEVSCPAGHADTARVFTAVAVGGRAGSGPAPVTPAAAGGACCGGGCCA